LKLTKITYKYAKNHVFNLKKYNLMQIIRYLCNYLKFFFKSLIRKNFSDLNLKSLILSNRIHFFRIVIVLRIFLNYFFKLNFKYYFLKFRNFFIFNYNKKSLTNLYNSFDDLFSEKQLSFLNYNNYNNYSSKLSDIFNLKNSSSFKILFKSKIQERNKDFHIIKDKKNRKFNLKFKNFKLKKKKNNFKNQKSKYFFFLKNLKDKKINFKIKKKKQSIYFKNQNIKLNYKNKKYDYKKSFWIKNNKIQKRYYSFNLNLIDF